MVPFVSLTTFARCFTLIVFVCVTCRAQDLSPRAYIITPIHSNAVVLTYSFRRGIVINPTLPVNDASGTLDSFIFSYFRTFSFFGRSANVTVSLPYTVGNFRANVEGVPTKVYRSGLVDSAFRFSVNLHGGPAMDVGDFIPWKQKLIVGVSMTIIPPTGQYDPMLLPGKNTQLQNPLGALQAHLSYDIRPRLWLSADANYFYGGSTNFNGVKSLGTRIGNSKIGVTASVPLYKNQSLKFSYSYAAIARVGGNYHDIAVGWQYSWLGRPN